MHEVHAADAAGVADDARVTIRQHLYPLWSAIAQEHLLATRVARRNPSAHDPLGKEMRSSLVAICASAFAVEALSRELDDLVVHHQVSQAWVRNQTRAVSRVHEILKLAVDVPGDELAALVDRLRTVFEARDRAVHFEGAESDPVPHPTGTRSSPETVTYSLESAEAAVRAMLDVFAAVAERPKGVIASFARSHTHVLTDAAGGN